MTVSVLGPGGYSRAPYGAFSGKTTAPPVTSTAGQTVLMPGISRERFRQIKAAERARLAAERRAERLKKEQKAALEAAAGIAEEAISRASLLEDFAPDMAPLTRALEEVAHAKAQNVVALSAAVTRLAEHILHEMEDEDDVMMLLMS